MRNRNDVPTRNELEQIDEKSQKDMEEKGDDIEKIVEDVESIRELLKEIHRDTTSDGAEILEKSIENTETVTVVEYEMEDEKLEDIQSDNLEFEGELKEKQDLSEGNMDKVLDTEKGITTRETIDALMKVKDAVNQEIDFMCDHIERTRAAREESDRKQDALSNRVRSGYSG